MYYKLKRQTEKIGSRTLEVECLYDLDSTIDELFEELQKKGDPSLLEELCPYFGIVWPSARALAEEIAQLGLPQLAKKRVLEVGCGLAIPGMVATQYQADVTVTDFHPEVPKFLEKNLELNQITELKFQKLNWQNEDEIRKLGTFDWVIGSDILYERAHSDLVARVIASLVAPGGTAIVTDPGRPYLQEFADKMKSQGFDYSTHARTVPHGDVMKDIFILTFKRLT